MNNEERKELLRLLKEVRKTGTTNMILMRNVSEVLYTMGEDWAAEQISSMSAQEYISLLDEF